MTMITTRTKTSFKAQVLCVRNKSFYCKKLAFAPHFATRRRTDDLKIHINALNYCFLHRTFGDGKNGFATIFMSSIFASVYNSFDLIQRVLVAFILGSGQCHNSVFLQFVVLHLHERIKSEQKFYE